MVKKRIVACLAAMTVLCLSTGCQNHTEKAKTVSSFQYIKEEDVPKDMQIVELGNSDKYYQMEAAADASCVYFYSLGFDGTGRLIDKSIITTLPTGVKKGDKFIVNVTLPDTKYPAYAISYISEGNKEVYYTMEYDEDDHGKIVAVEDNKELLLSD